tara:strand:+ start:95 stop:436 length:342 start_codon:yes stop_codon:yes gene_type:complete
VAKTVFTRPGCTSFFESLGKPFLQGAHQGLPKTVFTRCPSGVAKNRFYKLNSGSPGFRGKITRPPLASLTPISLSATIISMHPCGPNVKQSMQINLPQTVAQTVICCYNTYVT